MIHIILTVLLFNLSFINTFAQHNTQLVNQSPVDITKTPNGSSMEIVIDSDIEFEEALYGQKIPSPVKAKLTSITVQYYSFDDKIHQGQLIINKEVAKDLEEIFAIILEIHFPIEKVIPISQYKWSDDESMNDNNTSSFNYRFISGSKILSKHASGLAIDINPKQNPYIKNGITSPSGSVYDTTTKGTISANSRIVDEFKKRGWSWGGDWNSLKDYQHFQKDISSGK